VKTPRSLSLHPLVESPDFRSLFIGDVLVQVGERYFILTFTWWLLAGPHADSSHLGLLLTLESLPILVVGVLAGPLIDRLNKKWCMLASTGLQASVIGAVAALVASDALTLPRLCIAAFVLGCLLPLFDGAANAGLAQSVAGARLHSAAAMQTATLAISNLVAAALSATVLATFGFVVAVVLNSGLYVTGAVFLLRLPTSTFAGSAGKRSYVSDLKAGIAYVLDNAPLASFVGIYLGELFLFAPLLVLIPMLVQSVLGGAVGWVAVLEAAFSIGAIVTAVALSLRSTGRGLYRRTVLVLALLGLLMIALTGIRSPYVMIPNVALMGACMALLMGLSNVLFHRAVPDEMKGRFFGVLDALAAAATTLGYAAVGIEFGSTGVSGVLIANGGALLLLGLVVLAAPRIRSRGVERPRVDTGNLAAAAYNSMAMLVHRPPGWRSAMTPVNEAKEAPPIGGEVPMAVRSRQLLRGTDPSESERVH
jgi:DHA3 family macrolide efflux protein-like MFS transporter